MKGNTLKEFMDDLLACGGPEKEFIYKDYYYIIQGDFDENENIFGLRLDIYNRKDYEACDFIQSIFFSGKSNSESVEKFCNAKIFNGKNIFEVEEDIEVLYG